MALNPVPAEDVHLTGELTATAQNVAIEHGQTIALSGKVAFSRPSERHGEHF